MATRTVAVNKTALAKARDRRRQLDKDRDAQDERIEEKTAWSLVALEALARAEAARDAAAAAVGDAVRDLLEEDVSPERAAALLELDVAEVRRLSKVTASELSAATGGKQSATGRQAAPAAGERGGTVTPIAEQGSEGAERRAG
jgi:hypothetical protein